MQFSENTSEGQGIINPFNNPTHGNQPQNTIPHPPQPNNIKNPVTDLLDLGLNTESSFAVDYYKSEAPNAYTPIGHLLHRAKYPNLHQAKYPNHPRETDTIANILYYKIANISKFDAILPVPSHGELNTLMLEKIPYLIVRKLSEISGVQPIFNALIKNTPQQAKSAKLKSEDISCTRQDLPMNLLLIDDFFETGDTARISINAIKSINPRCNITFVSCTKNKFGGIAKQYKATINNENPHGIARNGVPFIRLKASIDGNLENVCVFQQESPEEYNRLKEIHSNKSTRNNEITIYAKKNQKGYWVFKGIN